MVKCQVVLTQGEKSLEYFNSYKPESLAMLIDV